MEPGRQLERARVERPAFEPRDLALLSDERRLGLAPAGSHEHAVPPEDHPAQPLLLTLQQTMHQLEDREDVAPAGEDAELAVERRAAPSAPVARRARPRRRLRASISARPARTRGPGPAAARRSDRPTPGAPGAP